MNIMNTSTSMSSTPRTTISSSLPSFGLPNTTLGPIRRPKPISLASTAATDSYNFHPSSTTSTTTTQLDHSSNLDGSTINSNGTMQPTTISTTSCLNTSPSSSDLNFMKDFLNLLAESNAKLLLIANNTNESSSSINTMLVNERNMIIEVCSLIKIYGNSIDFGNNSDSKLLLDTFFKLLINLIEINCLDIVTRGHVLHVLELRNNRWQQQHGPSSNNQPAGALGGQPGTKSLNHAESGCHSDGHKSVQWQQSTSPASSNDEKITTVKDRASHYLKGELLIRNSDSGKVMGVKGRRVRMIEELSDTIISFQKVNKDDRDRRLQITGSNQLNIETAKRLIIDTIRRNASPVPILGTEDVIDAEPLNPYMPFNSQIGVQHNQGVQYNPNLVYGANHNSGNQFAFVNPEQLESSFKKGIQKSSSLGISLKPKADGLYSSSIRPAIYGADDVIYMSSNNHLLLNEAVALISNHFDVRKKKLISERNIITNSAINNSNNIIKQQQINQQLIMRKQRFADGASVQVPSVFGMGSIGVSRSIGSSNSYDDLLRPSKYQSSHVNLDEEDEEEPPKASNFKYFDMPSLDRNSKTGLSRIKSVLQSSTSSETMSPLFGDFLHRDSFDLNSNSTGKSGISMVKAVKKSASSNTIYSRQSSNIVANVPAEDDLLINLDTSSPWNRVEPLEPVVRMAKEAAKEELPSKVTFAVEGEAVLEGQGSALVDFAVDGSSGHDPEEEQITYDKLTLIKLSKSELSRRLPKDFESMKQLLPDIMI